ncbi:hypothetical protein [Bordetella genomosp. 11]|uniref:Uncharacterized protein n=1 Tax=Bordetella genomosp. 11 TaxID=1416808 RepID=A0A261UEI2_9BORD|nr:hypothetical protein [Bordetella genomosp. 11]OZI59917.1 hypothetical protein CAL28_10535 [Bordetella genomosp. 11]
MQFDRAHHIDCRAIVSDNTAPRIREALIGQLINELQEAVKRGWYVSGHSTGPELACEAIDIFALGVPVLTAMKADAWKAVAAGGNVGDKFALYVMSATIHAAEQLVDLQLRGHDIKIGARK